MGKASRWCVLLYASVALMALHNSVDSKGKCSDRELILNWLLAR